MISPDEVRFSVLCITLVPAAARDVLQEARLHGRQKWPQPYHRP